MQMTGVADAGQKGESTGLGTSVIGEETINCS
jgi:hypothetical protein